MLTAQGDFLAVDSFPDILTALFHPVTIQPQKNQPTAQPLHPTSLRLFEIWLGFLIKHQGQWSPQDERGLRAWADFGHQVTDEEFVAAREQALKVWQHPERCVVLCAGAICSPVRPRPTADQLTHWEQRWGCPVRISDCQNRCRHAPSTSLIDPVKDPVRPAKPIV